MTEEFKKVELPELVKFDENTKEITGKFISLEKSSKFEKSKLLTFESDGKNKSVFVTPLAIQLIESANLKTGDEFKLVWTGMQKNEDESQEYRTFDLFTR